MFKSAVLKVIDKEVLSHTSGTSSTSTSVSRGVFNNQTTATASNTVKTDHIQNITFESLEDPDDTLRVKFINQEFETPVGKNTAVYFMNNEPIAYIPSKKAECMNLNYLRNENQQSIVASIFVFILCCIPFVNILIYLGNLNKKHTYYSNGAFHDELNTRNVAIGALVLFMLVGMFKSLVLFIVVGIPVAGAFNYFMHKGEGLVYQGIKDLRNQAAEALNAIRDKM